MPRIRKAIWLLSTILTMTAFLPAKPARAQTQTPGTLTGKVVDSSNGRPVPGARASVVDHPDARATSDLDGWFSIKLPPGKYEVQLVAPHYGSSRVTDIVVEAGREVRISANLAPKADSGIEVVEVVADVAEASEATQLLKRKTAPTVGDSLGAESISKTPDSDAAEVVTRVPSVTIKDNKFVVIRGLNERYSSAALNGSRLPSTDPNKKIVPLDLFPADFIESLGVTKSYNADLPGDFAGGLVAIELTEPPQELTYGIGLSTGFNTATTFQDFDTYSGCGASDWFGFGNWCRNLPRQFPGSPIQGSETTPQVRYLVGSLPLNWELDSVTAPPSYSIDANLGGAIGPFSMQVAGTYGTKWEFHNDEIVRSRPNVEANADTLNNYLYDRSTFNTNLGAVLSSQYTLSQRHKINLRALYNHKSSDEVLNGQGSSESDQSRLQRVTSAVYTEDQLAFGQLTGSHLFDSFEVDWRASLAESREDQPDGKFLIYDREKSDPEAPFIFLFKDPSANRFFSKLDELLQDYYLDLTVPFRIGMPLRSDFSQSHFKSGLAYSFRDRDFSLRTFQTKQGNAGDFDFTQPPNDLLRASNYGMSGPLRFLESRQTSNFRATHEIAAAYGMFDVPVVPDLARLIFGYRVEYSYIQSRGDVIAQLASGFNVINDLDALPAASLVITPNDTMNIRAAYSQTVSRPEFRELNLALYPAAPGERQFQGNPTLVSASITNYDLRWDWFFSPLELISASFFYKQLQGPFENIIVLSASNLLDSVVNATDATVWGFEVELRKDFTFLVPLVRRWSVTRPLTRYVSDFEFTTNASYVKSEVTGIEAPQGVPAEITNPRRALQGQSPFVINAALQWEHYRWGTFRLLYNTAGRTIVAAGANGLPDIYAERRDQVDFVWINELQVFEVPLKFKFAAENLTNDGYEETQAPFTTAKYFTGVSFSLGLSYTF
jgi:hypothetical protein